MDSIARLYAARKNRWPADLTRPIPGPAEIAGCYELESNPVFPFGRRFPEAPLAIAEILRSRPKQTETNHDLPNHWPGNPAQPVRGRHRRGHGVHDVEPGERRRMPRRQARRRCDEDGHDS